jgi:hypothetical protein
MYMAHSPCFIDSPCLFPFPTPFSLTWNPLCCDRIRPPRSQVACKLTSPFLTLFPTLPPPNFQNPGYQRLTQTTLRIRHLPSGTLKNIPSAFFLHICTILSTLNRNNLENLYFFKPLNTLNNVLTNYEFFAVFSLIVKGSSKWFMMKNTSWKHLGLNQLQGQYNFFYRQKFKTAFSEMLG